MPVRFIHINGRLLPADEPAVASSSRAFRYGYGLFETMLVQYGRIRLKALHWERLREGMKALGMSAPPDFFQTMEAGLQALLRANGHGSLARVRLQVWPGSGAYSDNDDFAAEYCIESSVLGEEIFRFNSDGLVAGIAEGIVKLADSWSRLKSCSALPYALAARQGGSRGWDEALLLNQHGRIADGSISNVFWISKGKMFTPPLSEGGVAGVMRRHLLRFLPTAGYAVEEAAATVETLHKADAVLLSNAIRGLRWIKRLDGHDKALGPVAELHQKLLMSF